MKQSLEWFALQNHFYDRIMCKNEDLKIMYSRMWKNSANMTNLEKLRTSLEKKRKIRRHTEFVNNISVSFLDKLGLVMADVQHHPRNTVYKSYTRMTGDGFRHGRRDVSGGLLG